MNTEISLKRFECALSNDHHFLINPTVLNDCKHFHCKSCSFQIDLTQCNVCGTLNRKSLNQVEDEPLELTELKNELKLSIDNIFSVLERQTKIEMDKLRNHFDTHNDLVEVKLKYIEEEIDIRIESVKIQLEEIRAKLIEKLSGLKEKINQLILFYSLKFRERILKYNSSFHELQENIKKKVNQNEENLLKYQNNLKNLHNLMETLDKNIEFKVAEYEVNDELIGEILFKNLHSISSVEMIDLMKSSRHEIVDVEETRPWELFVLSNDLIASINYDDYCVTLYDQDFKLVKNIKSIGGQKFNPFGIASNENDQLFIADLEEHRIYKTDLDFNQIENIGKSGNGDYEFEYPRVISYRNGNLYVCDGLNRKIKVYSNSLTFLKALEVPYHPWILKTNETTLCVMANPVGGIYFYNLHDLKFKHKFNNGICKISEINSNFIEFNAAFKKVYFYDDNGNPIDEIELKGVEAYTKDHYDGSLVFINGHLFMTFHDTKKIIKFF